MTFVFSFRRKRGRKRGRKRKTETKEELSGNGRGRPRLTLTKENLQVCVDSGLTSARIAEIFGAGLQSVKRYLRMHKMRKKDRVSRISGEQNKPFNLLYAYITHASLLKTFLFYFLNVELVCIFIEPG